MIRLALPIVMLVALHAGAGPVGTLEDIGFWVGDGANRAAFAVDWDGAVSDDVALAWGYRWDGVATGEDLLRAVVAADPRLYAKLTTLGEFGRAVIGLGYDWDGDGAFALDDGTVFDADGLAVTAPSDGAAPLAGDLYREGWEDGYWHYGLRAAGGGWVTSPAGVSGRTLSDGDWDSHAFAVTLNFDEFAENLFAAPAPAEPGDFNRDGRVDAADYTAWRDSEGTSTVVPGAGADGDHSGLVNNDDHQLWRNHYGQGSAAVAVPEPTAGLLTLIGFFTTNTLFRRD